MRKRRLALFMAVLMAFISVPTTGLHVHASEELVVEESVSDESMMDALTEDNLLSDISLIENEAGAEPTEVEESEEEIIPDISEEILVESVEVVTDDVVGEVSELLSDGTEAWVNAEELTVGASYSVNLDEGESKYFKFTATDENAGKYRIYSFNNEVEGIWYDPYVELYKIENDQLTRLADNDDSAGNRNFILTYIFESGTTYYYEAHGFADDAASFSVQFEQISAVTSLSIVNTGKTDTVISGVDSGSTEFEGMLIGVTYEDNSYEEISIYDVTKMGDSITWAVHEINEDATVGAQVYDYSDLSGAYYAVVSCGEYSAVKTVNYISRSEAVGENVLDLETADALTLTNMRVTQGVAFTPTEDGEYVFSLSSGYFKGIYDSNSWFYGGGGDRKCVTLEADTTYYIFYTGSYSEEQDITVSVKQKKVLTAISCDAMKEISTFELFDYLCSFPVIVSYNESNEQETDINWSIGGTGPYYGTTSNADTLILDVLDENDKRILVDSDNYFTPGEYTVTLSVSGNSDITPVTQKITVNMDIDLILDIQEEYSYEDIDSVLYSVPLTIIYGNGTQYTIEDWDRITSVDEEGIEFQGYIGYGSFFERYIMSLRQNNQYVNVSSDIPTGEYILEVHLENNKELFVTRPVTVVAFADTILLEDGGLWDVSITNNESKVFEFTPSEENAGNYVIWSSSEDEDEIDPYVEMYEDTDGEISYLDEDDDGESGCNFKLRKTLEAGKTYYFVAKKYGSEQESFTVNFKRIPGVTSASFEQEYAAIVFTELQNMKEMSISVTYENDSTEQVNGWISWRDDDDNRRLRVYSDNDNEFVLTLEKKDEDNTWNIVDIPYNTVDGYSLGEYRLVLSEGTEKILSTMNFTVIFSEAEQMISMTDGGSWDVSITNSESKVFEFTPSAENAGNYEIWSSSEDEDETDPYVEMYGETDGEISYLDEDDDGESGYNFKLRKTLEVGKTYYFIAKKYGSEQESFTVNFKRIPGVTSASFEQEYAAIVFTELQNMKEMSISVTYENDSTEQVNGWISWRDDDDNRRLRVYSDNDNELVLTLEKKDEDNTWNIVDIPYNTGDGYSLGEYRLVLSEGIEKILSTMNFTVILPGAEQMISMTDEGSRDVSITNSESKVFEFTPSAENAGNYVIWSSSEDEYKIDPYVEMYEETDGEISYLDEDDDGESGCNFKLRKTLEAGKTYYFVVNKYGSERESFTVNFKKISDVTCASFEQEYTAIAFTELPNMKEMSISVTYENDSTEQVNGWSSWWDNDDDRRLRVYSDNDNEFVLTLEKKDADNTWNKVDIPSYSIGKSVHNLGEYRLILSEGTEKILSTMNFTVILPDAEQLMFTEINTVELLKNKESVYTFEVTEKGRYSFAKLSSNVWVDMAVYFYAEEEARLVSRIEGEFEDEVSAVQGKLDVGTYYVLFDGYDSSECQFQIRKVEKVSSIELIENEISKEFIQGLDKPSFGSSKVVVTYADGYTETVSPGSKTILGKKVKQKLYKVGEDGTPDWTIAYKLNTKIKAGRYILAAELKEDDKIHRTYAQVRIISQDEAAKRNEYTAESEKLTMAGNEKGYVCASYTAQTEG